MLTIIGVSVGTIAAFLNVMTEFLNDFKYGYCTNGVWLNKSFCCAKGVESCDAFVPWSNHILVNFLIHLVLCLAFGFLASWVCVTFAPFAAGSGISEVKCIVSGFKMKSDFLSPLVLIVKSLMLPFGIASGVQVGKEGPSVHYASCVGNVIPPLIVKWFAECPTKMSDFITAGASTGVAVAFGSPISGVLFGLEEICNKVSIGLLWKCFYASFIGTSVLQAWDPFGTGQIVMFSVKFENSWKFSELPIFIIIGVFGGLYGGFVCKWNIKYVTFRRKYFAQSGVLEVVILCFLTAIIGYPNIFIRYDMTRVMEILFTNEDSGKTSEIFELIIATIIRTMFIVVSYGCKIPCGIFVPSMAVGATFGKLLGLSIKAISPSSDIDPAIYSFLGAGAALSGITGLSVTVVIIMFELTGAVKYIVPMMIIVLVVKVTYESTGNGQGGIADKMIEVNGMPYLDPKEEYHFDEDFTAQLMIKHDQELITLETTMSLKDIRTTLASCQVKDLPIVQNGNLLATISRLRLETLIQKDDLNDTIDDAESTLFSFIGDDMILKMTNSVPMTHGGLLVNQEWVNYDFVTINKDSSMNKMTQMFVDLGCKTIYIIDEHFQLVGVCNKKDIIKYNIQHAAGHEFVTEKDYLMMEKIWFYYQSIGQYVINVPSMFRSRYSEL